MKLCVWGGACGWVPLLVVTPRPPPGACAVSAPGRGLGSRDPVCRLSPAPHFLSKEAPVCPRELLVHLLQRVQLLSSLGWGRGSPGCTGRWGPCHPAARPVSREPGISSLQPSGTLDCEVVLRGFPVPASEQCSSPRIFSVVFLGLRLVSEGPSGLIL